MQACSSLFLGINYLATTIKKQAIFDRVAVHLKKEIESWL